MRYHLKNDNRYIVRSLLRLMGLIILATLMVYGLNSELSRLLYFSIIIGIFFLSKDTVFSLALIFILSLNPWAMFYSSPYDWVITITPTVGFNYSIAFAISIFIKYFFIPVYRRKLKQDYLSRYYRLFGFYLLFMLAWGLIYGHSSKSLYSLVNSLAVLSLFLVIPRLFNHKELLLFNKIIFGFCILHTVLSTIDVATSGEVSRLFVFYRRSRGPAVEGELVRVFGGAWLALYSLIVSFYYLIKRQKEIKQNYLFIVVFLSILTIINTGTRGWMLGAFVFIVGVILNYFIRGGGSKIVQYIIIAFLFGILILPNSVKVNISESVSRFNSVKYVVEGDITAGGTVGRWDVRGPIILEQVKRNPVFGYGFSKISSQFWDPHVGNHTLLLMGGIVGFLILWLTVLYIIYLLFRTEFQDKRFRGIFVFGLGIAMILVIHSSNMLAISYERMPPQTALIIALLFNQVNAIMQNNTR